MAQMVRDILTGNLDFLMSNIHYVDLDMILTHLESKGVLQEAHVTAVKDHLCFKNEPSHLRVREFVNIIKTRGEQGFFYLIQVFLTTKNDFVAQQLCLTLVPGGQAIDTYCHNALQNASPPVLSGVPLVPDIQLRAGHLLQAYRDMGEEEVKKEGEGIVSEPISRPNSTPAL